MMDPEKSTLQPLHQSNTPKPPVISISESRSSPNMRRAFSRRERSHIPTEKPLAMHGRNHSMTYGKELSPPPTEGGLGRRMSKREKFVRALTNPDTIFRHDPGSPPPESKFNPNPNGKLIRTFFSNSLDVAPSAPAPPPTPPTPLPDADAPIFDGRLVSQQVWSDLPNGYHIRPLQRSDYGRGYMDVVRIVGKTGWVGEDVWEARCEWLRRNSDNYFIVVILDPEDTVVATGTVLFERKFTHNMGIVAHVEDIAVARTQRGKKMGLRVLEALVHAATEYGAYKTVVNCTESNEAFHAQSGFVREGSQMVLQNTKKAVEGYV